MDLLLCLLLTWLQYLPWPGIHSELQWKGSQIQSQLLWTVRLRVATGRFDSQKFGPDDPRVSRILWTRNCGKWIYELLLCITGRWLSTWRQAWTQPSFMPQSQAPSLTRVDIKHSSTPPKPTALDSKQRNTIHPSLSKAWLFESHEN